MSPVISNLLLKSTAETFYMLGVSALIAAVVGIPLGILLVVTEKNGILACRLLNKPLAFVINMIRSIPFIILMVAIIPLTRLIHRPTDHRCDTVHRPHGRDLHP